MIGEKNNFPIACCCSCNATCVCVHVKMTVNTALSVSDKQRLDGSALADERKDEGKRLARSTLLLIRTSSLHGCCWLFFFFSWHVYIHVVCLLQPTQIGRFVTRCYAGQQNSTLPPCPLCRRSSGRRKKRIAGVTGFSPPY